MKTKDLIKILQKEDPSGELEVSVGGEDIYFVERLPGYYDGPYEVLIKDDGEGYNIVGIRITDKGEKVVIHTESLSGLLWDNCNNDKFKIDLDVSENRKQRYKENIEKIKNDIKESGLCVECE